ncbi:glycosyltransferase [Microbulbifer salipaludis]|nr:glycosyltransferase [Microbulbifer salipaludis]
MREANLRVEKMLALGFVVIGRNEGERLRRCLESILEQSIALRREMLGSESDSDESVSDLILTPIVYVDSGSDDGSVDCAKNLGCDVVQLAATRPFTAARARNAGLERLIEISPAVEFVQFIDGDCSLQPGWLSKAIAFSSVNPEAAIVCGRRREVYPQKTVYNALCDIEWDTPIGESNACGGDFFARRIAIESVQAFNSDMIAGEEPEMCFRLRKENWRIWRIDCEMTSHDAAMTSFRQFWLRNVRAGFAYAERCAMHATKKRPYCVREISSIFFWAFLIPVAALTLAPAFAPISILILMAYPAIVIRIFLRRIKLRNSIRRSFVYSMFTLLAKFPQFLGATKYFFTQLAGRKAAIIEYK